MTAHFGSSKSPYPETPRERVRRWVTAPIFLSLIAIAVVASWVKDAFETEDDDAR